MRVAVSFWFASVAFVVVVWVNSIRLSARDENSWLDHVFTPFSVIAVLPSLLAGLIALLLRARPVWIQLVTSATLFLCAAPAITLLAEWARFAFASDTPYEGFYEDSVVLSLIAIHGPQLIVALIVFALVGLVRWVYLRGATAVRPGA